MTLAQIQCSAKSEIFVFPETSDEFSRSHYPHVTGSEGVQPERNGKRRCPQDADNGLMGVICGRLRWTWGLTSIRDAHSQRLCQHENRY